MSVSDLEIWKHATNIIQRASYGVNGKKHFDIQKKRTKDMSKGGNGGQPGNAIMVDTTEHVGSIREMHFDDWLDADFQGVLDIILKWEKDGSLPPKPAENPKTSVELAVERAHDIFRNLDRDDQVDALNALAEALGVMGEDEDAE